MVSGDPSRKSSRPPRLSKTFVSVNHNLIIWKAKLYFYLDQRSLAFHKRSFIFFIFFILVRVRGLNSKSFCFNKFRWEKIFVFSSSTFPFSPEFSFLHQLFKGKPLKSRQYFNKSDKMQKLIFNWAKEERETNISWENVFSFFDS